MMYMYDTDTLYLCKIYPLDPPQSRPGQFVFPCKGGFFLFLFYFYLIHITRYICTVHRTPTYIIMYVVTLVPSYNFVVFLFWRLSVSARQSSVPSCDTYNKNLTTGDQLDEVLRSQLSHVPYIYVL